MAADKNFALERYLQIIWYRKWLLVVPIVTMVLVTGIGSLFLTNIYRSYTLILVEPQQVPQEFVKSSVSMSVEKHMNTIRQQLLSRSILERVINEYHLYPDLVARNVPMEEILELMRANIELRVEGKDAFTLYFQGPDPHLVMQVTNKMASLFIEGTMATREQQAGETVDFLETQAKELKATLDNLDQQIRAFKQQHIGELPEQMEANLRTIERLQMQLQVNSDSLRSAQDRRTLISAQLAEMRQKSVISGKGGEVVGTDVQLEQLRAELANLQLKYTDEHPDVIKLKSRIATLERRLAEPVEDGGGGAITSSLEMSLRGADLEIQRIGAERASLQGQVALYQKRVESAPQVEQDLQVLTRDYDNTQTAYQDIQKKLTEAKRSADMESKQKGQQFRVIDPAQQPKAPYKPNRLYIAIVGFALGTLIGMGAVFLAEHFDDSFKDPEEMEDALGMTVLTAVPLIDTHEDLERRARTMQAAIVVGIVLAAGLVVAAVVRFVV